MKIKDGVPIVGWAKCMCGIAVALRNVGGVDGNPKCDWLEPHNNPDRKSCAYSERYRSPRKQGTYLRMEPARVICDHQELPSGRCICGADLSQHRSRK